MAHVLTLSRDDPVIHLKAYGGVQIEGVDRPEVTCEIDAPQLATLIEEEGHVYVTVNTSCQIVVPVKASIEIERGMGSVLIKGVLNPINVEKVLGNLVLMEVGQAVVGKVGGNFSARNSSGKIEIDKVGGSLTVDACQGIAVNKIGGNCVLRDIHGDARVEKAGGKCLAQNVTGQAMLGKFGGSFKARGLTLAEDVKVGGNIELIEPKFSGSLSVQAGGNIVMALPEEPLDLSLNIASGSHRIKIKAQGDVIETRESEYTYQIGAGGMVIDVNAGGSVSIVDITEPNANFIGDLSDRFTFEESAFSAMIQDRIDSATRRAEAKVKAAEIRLGQIQDRVEKFRGIKVDVGIGDDEEKEAPYAPASPVPPVTRPAGKKGATDEERLMILKMLQDGTITVDEAETLFRAMES